MTPHVIITRSRAEDAERRAFEDRLSHALVQTHGVACLITPHLYDLPQDHRALRRMGALAPPLIVAGWMWPRPLEWIARYRLDRRDMALNALDLRKWSDADQAAQAIAQALSDGTPRDNGEAQTDREPAGIEDLSDDPGAQRWYPVIDYGRCVDCGQCLEFCMFHVYSHPEGASVQVAAPDNCKPGCPACSRVCPHEAIIFPHYAADRAIAGAPGAQIVPLSNRDKDSLLAQARAVRPAMENSGMAPRTGGTGSEATGGDGKASDRGGAGAKGTGDDLDRLIDALEDLER